MRDDRADDFDFVVVGAGMAGASIAAELARTARVALVERESQPGYHTTGRSAALYSELYGNETVRALTRASRPALFAPAPEFSPVALARPRDTLYFAASGESALLDGFVESLPPALRPRRIDGSAATALAPVFRPGWVEGALVDGRSADLDVAALLQAYVREARRAGAVALFDRVIRAIERREGAWRIDTGAEVLRAPVLVDAAGAWGDEVARAAGVAPIGLVARRRTALLVDVPDGRDATEWPAAVHVAESFYFKPDAGLLLLSPADETPVEPGDAQPEELDVAIAVDRFEQATGLAVRRVRSRWAGLRTFVDDRTPVVGFDAVAEGFFWFVGQGGYGIQMAPALARVGASLATGRTLDEDLREAGVSAEALSPGRCGSQERRRPRTASA